MYYGGSIRCLTILAVLYNQLQLLALCEYSQDRVTVLNILLKFPAWGQIDKVRAKSGNDSFTGMDLYLTYVDASNVDTNYRKAIHLLACEYANAMLHFITSLQCIIQQSYREGFLMTKRLRGRKISHQKRQKVGDIDLPAYTINWKLLNLAVGEIKKSILMFNCMRDAMEYLRDLVVPMEGGYKEISDLNSVLSSVHRLQSLALNTNDEIPGYREGYGNADDSDVVKLNQDLNRILQHQVKFNLTPFTNTYCILTKNVQRYASNQRTSINYDLPAEGLKIKKLVEDVVNNYPELGFEYVKQFQINHNKPENSET